MIERPYLKEEYDHMPQEKYVGIDHPVHRFADFIPVADDKDQYALRGSIAEIGLLDPIILFQGEILDGRHRYKACQVLGVEPRFEEFPSDSEEAALQFVLAKNVARRQLTTVQKLMLREKLQPEIERLKQAAIERQLAGAPSTTVGEGLSRVDEQVGAIIGLSRETQRQYDRLKEIADVQPEAKEFLAEMLAGDIGVKKAYEQARSISDDLDREARLQAPPSTDKMRATLIANIQKAVDLLCGYDVNLLSGLYVEALDELEVWVTSAYGVSN